MLQRTFCHLQGVGPTTERRLWRSGARDWDTALGDEKFSRFHADLAESKQRFSSSDWKFFDQKIPTAEKWRAFGELGSRALYVDIETDGGMDEDCITVLGCYDGRTAHTFVRGRDLEAGKELIESHPLVVTFNGVQFDLPVIRRRFAHNLFNHVHIDLRFPLKRVGLSGGLKSIEQQFGIVRAEATRGLGGYDAVRLWHAYEDGSNEALELLLAYNREDIRNMEPLMKHAFQKLAAACELDQPPALRCEIVAAGSLRHAEMIALRNETLRRPLGLEFTPAELAKDKFDTLIVCVDGAKTVGCCILTDAGMQGFQLRQMAVAADEQGRGVGRIVVEFAERTARERGSHRLFMHARKTAVGFYEKLGYRVCGPEYVLVGIPHFDMEKFL